MRRSLLVVVLPFVLLIGVAGCSKDPERLKRDYVASGDRYVAQKKYAEAVIEFRNAVAIDPRFGEARSKLAFALEQAGDAGGALGEYIRAADLLPNDPKVQLAAGQRLLLAGKYPEARARASTILEKDPRDVGGLVLMGNALAGLKDFDGAISEIEEAIDADPRGLLWYTNLGLVQMAKGDTPAAESVFKRAVEVQPKSASAHYSLANFYWAAGRQAEAETELKSALALDPKSVVVLRALATFYTSAGRLAEAETYFKNYVAQSGDSASKLLLADFYLRAKKTNEATTLLTSIATDKTQGIPATLRLAALDYDAGNTNKAHRTVDDVLQREPKDEQALLLKGRFLLADKKPADALTMANRAIDVNARSSRGLFIKASALEATGARDKAIETLLELVRENPASSAPAQLLLAHLYQAQGNLNQAAQFASQVIKSQPQSVDAHLLLANISLLQGNLTRAESELKGVAVIEPGSADVHNAFGAFYWRKGNIAGARASFTKALALQPNSVTALAGLVQTDLADKRPDAARARIQARLDAAPNDAALWNLAGITYAALGDKQKAEMAFRKAIDFDPTNFFAYNSLGAGYMAQHRLDEAKDNYAEAARRQDKPVAATTMLGVILTLQNKPDEARIQYERALSIDPQAAVAANNLAWDYAERGGNLDAALQLAQTAKAQLPNNAEVSDTLGWIYYKKGLAGLAITALESGVAQDKNNPMIHYHLGLAYAKNGKEPDAKRALEQALKLNPQFAGAADAKRVLGTLKG